jgi:hypothetical protein
MKKKKTMARLAGVAILAASAAQASAVPLVDLSDAADGAVADAGAYASAGLPIIIAVTGAWLGIKLWKMFKRA